MKNAYGINITGGRDDGRIDAEPFLLRTVSDTLGEEQAAEREDYSSIRLEKQSFLYKTPIINRIFRCKRETDAQEAELQERSQKLHLNSCRELGIPDNAPRVDVLCFAYVERKGRKRDALGAYIPFAVRLFLENGMLCLGSADSVLGVSLKAVYGIYEVRRKVQLSGWTKPEPYDSERYRPFGVRRRRGGYYRINSLYSLRFATTLGDFEILIPPYDVMPFSLLCGRAVVPAGKQ